MLSKDELLKLSERALAKEYTRIMGLAKPVGRISGTPEVRGKYIDEMLAKIAATPEAAEETAAPGAEASDGEKKEKKKRSSKAKSNGEAKRTRTSTYEKVAASVKNPYRESSKKHKAFEVFREGGDRQALAAKIVKLGVTESTAASWMNIFKKVK